MMYEPYKQHFVASFTHVASFTQLQVRGQFIATVSHLSQAVQQWTGCLEDLGLECGVAATHAPLDASAAAAHNDAVFKAFFSGSINSDNPGSDAVFIAAAPDAANDAAIRSWRESGSGDAIHEKCRGEAPPYAPLLSAYLQTTAAAAATGAAAAAPVASQLASLAATPPSEVFHKILTEKSASSSGSTIGGSSSSSNLSAAAAFAAAAGTAIPQQFSLAADSVLQPHHAPLWAESMGELGAGLLCLQQLRSSNTNSEEAQSFCDEASKLWSHSSVMTNYLSLTASITRTPPGRMRTPAASPEVTHDAWWLPDVESVSVVVAEDSMWKSEWQELGGSAGVASSWEAAVRHAAAQSGDDVHFPPWKEEALVQAACAQLVGGDMADDLCNIGGVGAVAEHIMSGTSGAVPLATVEALFAVSDVANQPGIGSESTGVSSGEVLCDLVCNVGGASGGGAFEAAVAALNCSDWLSPPLSLHALSYALSLYPSAPVIVASSMSMSTPTPPPSPGLIRSTPTPPPRKSSLASIEM